MTEIFSAVLKMSFSATFLIVAVVLWARILMKKAPKWIRGVLWAMVALRLVVPLYIESPVSLVPTVVSVDETEQAVSVIDEAEVPATEQAYTPPVVDMPVVNVPDDAPVVDIPSPDIFPTLPQGNTYPITDEPVVSEPIVDAPVVTPDEAPEAEPVTTPDESKGVDIGFIGAVVWCVGALALSVYCVVSYWRMKIKLMGAVRIEEGVYESEWIKSAFVLGIIKPVVYVPRTLAPEEREYVLAHERVHISRFDHVFKPLGFLILALHWFNPTVWLAYFLYCRDIELACDEKAIRGYTVEQVKRYSKALVSCGEGHFHIPVCPIAFGEVGIKARVKNILNYKKPGLWIMIGAAVVCVIVAVCFMTVRGDKETGASADSTEQSETDGTESTEGTEDSTDGTEEPTDTTEPTDDPTDPTEEPTKPGGSAGDEDPNYVYVPTTVKPTGERVDFEQVVIESGARDALGDPTWITAEIQNTTETFELYTKCEMGFDFIHTYEELQNALEKYEGDPDGNHDFAELYDYGEDFFEDKALISTIRVFSAGSLSYSLEGVYKSGNVLGFNVSTDLYRSDYAYPDVIAVSARVYEIEKTALDGIDTVSLYVEEMDTGHPAPMPEPTPPEPIDPIELKIVGTNSRPVGAKDIDVQPGLLFSAFGGLPECFEEITVHVANSVDSTQWYAICVFDSYDEFSGLIDTINEGKTYNKVELPDYGEKFFRDNVLILIYWQKPDRVSVGGGELCFEFEHKKSLLAYGLMTPDVVNPPNYYGVAVSREELDGVDTLSILSKHIYRDLPEQVPALSKEYTVSQTDSRITGEKGEFAISDSYYFADWGFNYKSAGSFSIQRGSNKKSLTVVVYDEEFWYKWYLSSGNHTYSRDVRLPDVFSKYDSDFFSEKVLIMLNIPGKPYECGADFDGVKDGKLYFTAKICDDTAFSNDNYYSSWVFAEIDRSIFDKADEIAVNIEWTLWDFGQDDPNDCEYGIHDFKYSMGTCGLTVACRRCGLVDYEPSNHDWADATCTEPATCKGCGATKGEPLGHSDTTTPDCTEGGKCSACGAVMEAALGHSLVNNICVRSGCGERGVIYDNVLYGKASSSYTEYELGQLDCRVALFNKYTLNGKSAVIEIKINNELVHWQMSRVNGYAAGALTDLGSVKLSDDGKSIIIPFTGEGEYLIDICYGAADMPYVTTVSIVLGS